MAGLLANLTDHRAQVEFLTGNKKVSSVANLVKRKLHRVLSLWNFPEDVPNNYDAVKHPSGTERRIGLNISLSSLAMSPENDDEPDPRQQKSTRDRCRGLMEQLFQRQPMLPALEEHDKHKRNIPNLRDNCGLCDNVRKNHCPSDRERKNIILELYVGECEHLKDLRTAIKSFMEPVRLLQILTETEIHQIFYTIEDVIPIFERSFLNCHLHFFKVLVCSLSEAIHKNCSFSTFVQLIYKWVEKSSNPIIFSQGPVDILKSSKKSDTSESPVTSMEVVIEYVSHLYVARECLEATRKHKREFSDFLARCHKTAFSKRLDLWHFLDTPRTRLIRYPLIINRLIKLTTETDPDKAILIQIRNTFERIVRELDNRAAEIMCRFHLHRIQLSSSLPHSEVIKRQKTLLLSGTLKTKEGPVKAFVFTEVMLLTLPCPPSSRLSRLDSDVADSSEAANKRDLDGIFAAKCCVSPSIPTSSSVTTTTAHLSGRWSVLTRRLSNCYDLRRAQLNNDSVSIATNDALTITPSRRTNSVPVNPIPDAISYLERYRIYKQPILLQDCILENLTDGETRFTSLRRTLLLDNSGQNMFRIHQNNHQTVRVREQKSFATRRHTAPVGTDSTNGRRLFLSDRLRGGIFRAASHRHPVSSRLKPKANKYSIILLQASSAEEKTLWLSTLTPLVGKMLPGN
ncbi:hypothetical protein D915_002133 [Fasciola hepatica]|uniref:DH domain-containing protein n=1 Tax=Fasciola hepatica TaxID=6192 RepID=A0A4E0S1K6_FASHE|nr:hypothetical protein D915_002133 [Fasciola hepatica]